MTIYHLLLGRPRQQLRCTLHEGCLNTYSFHCKGKQVILQPLPRNRQPCSSTSPAKTTLLVDYDTFCKDVDDNDPVFGLTNTLDIPTTSVPPEMATLLDMYAHLRKNLLADIVPQILIQLQPGASLPNLPHYITAPTEHVELCRQVQDLSKGFIQGSIHRVQYTKKNSS